MSYSLQTHITYDKNNAELTKHETLSEIHWKHSTKSISNNLSLYWSSIRIQRYARSAQSRADICWLKNPSLKVACQLLMFQYFSCFSLAVAPAATCIWLAHVFFCVFGAVLSIYKCSDGRVSWVSSACCAIRLSNCWYVVLLLRIGSCLLSLSSIRFHSRRKLLCRCPCLLRLLMRWTNILYKVCWDKWKYGCSSHQKS